MIGAPGYSIALPPSVRPGETFVATLSLESPSPRPMLSLDLVLEGSEKKPGLTGTLRAAPFLRVATRLSGEGVLSSGLSRHDVSLTLPGDSPPSFRGLSFEVSYQIRFDLAFFRWLDFGDSRELVVLPRPVARPTPAPRRAGSADPWRPFLELLLDDQNFRPGDQVTGVLAVGNLGGAHVRSIELGILGLEQAHARSVISAPSRWLSEFQGAQGLLPGLAFPFFFSIPSHACPSFQGPCASLSWRFGVRLMLDDGRTIEQTAPITLGSYDAVCSKPQARADVGRSRWRAGWEEQGRARGLSMDEAAHQLRGVLSGLALRVSPGSGPAGADGLEGELRWRSLGLSLSVQERRWSLLSLRTGDRTFDRRFAVSCREPAQGKAALTAAVRDALRLFDTARLHDQGAELFSRIAWQDGAALAVFLDRLDALASALARAAEGLPPPACMRELVPAWHAFAARHSGKLLKGGMRLLDLRLDGGLFDIVPLFTGAAPSHTLVRLIHEPPLEPRDGSPISPPPSWPELLDRAPPGTQAPALRHDRTELALTFVPPDPAALEGVMAQLPPLLLVVRGEAGRGPYR